MTISKKIRTLHGFTIDQPVLVEVFSGEARQPGVVVGFTAGHVTVRVEGREDTSYRADYLQAAAR